jgi:hypothetical protein
MIRRTQFALAAAAAGMALLACSIEIPSLQFGPDIQIAEPGEVEVGSTQTESIRIPATGDRTSLDLEFGGGKIRIVGGGEDLVSGTATYNVAELNPVIEGSGSSFRLRNGDTELIPGGQGDIVNSWELQLGSDPIDLTIDLGAADAKMDLGGLNLTQLDIHTAASDLELGFSEPNRGPMGSLTVMAGAARLDLSQLSNANSPRMEFTLGGGDVTLDFSCDLSQDVDVTIEGAAGNFTIYIPDGTPARARTSGAFLSINAGSGWQAGDNGYAHEGQGPQINLSFAVGAGNINLRTN